MIPVGALASRAARVIHTDFEKGFIRAEIYSLADLEQHHTEKDIRAAGKLRVEGKDYVMRDGDICHFLVNRCHPLLPEDFIMPSLAVGDVAPAFSAVLQDGSRFDSASVVGKKTVVLFFYPKDNPPVCTKEACAFRDSYKAFTAAGVEVIGVSSDSPAAPT